MLQVDGITIGSLDDVPGGPITSFFRSVRNTLDFDFEDENEGKFLGKLYLCDRLMMWLVGVTMWS